VIVIYLFDTARTRLVANAPGQDAGCVAGLRII